MVRLRNDPNPIFGHCSPAPGGHGFRAALHFDFLALECEFLCVEAAAIAAVLDGIGLVECAVVGALDAGFVAEVVAEVLGRLGCQDDTDDAVVFRSGVFRFIAGTLLASKLAVPRIGFDLTETEQTPSGASGDNSRASKRAAAVSRCESSSCRLR